MGLNKTNTYIPKLEFIASIKQQIGSDGYQIVEANETKPWGAYYRIDSHQVEKFIAQYFPGLTLEQASLGIKGLQLSPKILIVSPGQRLSWQYHHRRAERWTFLTSGAYYRSDSDEQGELTVVEPGHVVQFERSERHRLVGLDSGYTIVAEIWQHTDADYPSDEEDIVRLQDDYSR